MIDTVSWFGYTCYMRISNTFWNTLREAPAGIELPGQQFLLRAGLVRSPAAAVWSTLPLGQRAWERLLAATTTIAEAHGGQRVSLPPVRPAESNGGRGSDWQCGDAPTWAAWDLAEREIRSYRHLPHLLYDVYPMAHGHGQIRAGFLGSAMTRQLTLFGFYAEPEQALDAQRRLRMEFVTLLEQLGLKPHVALAGPHESRSWLFECEEGNIPYWHCDECGYVGLPSATVIEPKTDESVKMLEPEEVETPDCTTIADLATFVGVPASQTMKVVFYTTDGDQVICAVIRGDLNIDEDKLSAALGGESLYPSSSVEVRSVGSVPGYGSPVGLRGAAIIVDPSVMAARNLVAGANREPYHMLNINAGRDFVVDQVIDLRAVEAGDPCPGCDQALADGVAFELGRDVVLPADVSRHPDANYLDDKGKSQPIVLTQMVLDLDRVFAAVAEANHDDNGLCWPAAVAPAQVHLLGIKIKKNDVVRETAHRLYERLRAKGISVLLDDRDERPGVAFKEADLLGVPLRLTVSPRSLEAGGIEVKWRTEEDRSVVTEDELGDLLTQLGGLSPDHRDG